MASEARSGSDPTLYLYTSLTAGSSHIITATSRLETILKANKIAFRAIDCATDEKARTLWGRRSKNRKLPGLVKYGQVIGDLKEVEEWNEYGEIKENIENVSDIFGDTPMTDTPMPPPAPITLKDPLAKVSEPPSRSSSETRHISISDPKDKDGSGSPGSSVKNLKDDNPMSMAMRQAGAEAAAKAGQRKTSTTSSSKSSSTASTIPAKRDSSDTTPSATAIKGSIDAEEPAAATEITEAKTPMQLAAEGAKKTSVDKIAGTSPIEGSSPLAAEPRSNEEQMLEARRSSSIAKVPSRLAQETSIDEVATPTPETAVDNTTAAPEVSETPLQHHRGSSLSDASKDEIKEAERKTAIQEEIEEDDNEHAGAESTSKKPKVAATDEVEKEVMQDTKPQDQKVKDADAAGVSVAAAMFLAPNHTPNPNRLSTDSASVYSFFDTAFSPAPLFSGSKNLDLDLSFMDGLGTSDPRASVSTYGTNGVDRDQTIGNLANGTEDDQTPRQSQDTARHQSISQGSSRREFIPSMPVIAPLRTQTRRQASDPMLSGTNRVSTPSSVPLPLNIRKLPAAQHAASPSSSHSPNHTPQASRTQPTLQTSDIHPLNQNHSSLSPQLPGSSSTVTSPISPNPASTTPITLPTSPASATTAGSRSLRFKKSIRSLRSKKSAQQLTDFSEPMPPNLPPQRQLKDMRSVSEGPGGDKKKDSGRERGKLLCF